MRFLAVFLLFVILSVPLLSANDTGFAAAVSRDLIRTMTDTIHRTLRELMNSSSPGDAGGVIVRHTRDMALFEKRQRILLGMYPGFKHAAYPELVRALESMRRLAKKLSLEVAAVKNKYRSNKEFHAALKGRKPPSAQSAVNAYAVLYKGMEREFKQTTTMLLMADSGGDAAGALTLFKMETDKFKKKNEELSRRYPGFKPFANPALADRLDALRKASMIFGEQLKRAIKQFGKNREFKKALARLRQMN